MGRLSECTKEDFILAAKNSISMKQFLIFLGANTGSRNYNLAKKYIRKMNLNISHFMGRGWKGAVGNEVPNKRSIEVYLSNEFYLQSDALKKRLIQEGFFKHQCNICKNTEWVGVSIPIVLHHKDGNPRNNNLVNLQILCPNCHAQTTNYCGMNKQKMITFNGKTQSIVAWAKEYGLNPKTLRGRLYKINWSIEKALTTPPIEFYPLYKDL